MYIHIRWALKKEKHVFYRHFLITLKIFEKGAKNLVFYSCFFLQKNCAYYTRGVAKNVSRVFARVL